MMGYTSRTLHNKKIMYLKTQDSLRISLSEREALILSDRTLTELTNSDALARLPMTH